MNANKYKWRQFISCYLATFLVLLVMGLMGSSVGGYGLAILPAINGLAFVVAFNAGVKKKA